MSVICFEEHYHTISSGRRERVYYLNLIANLLYPFMASVFPTGNGIFQENSVLYEKGRNELEVFKEHTNKFHLIFWPPNSAYLNLIEMKLSDQTSSSRNLTTLRDHYLDNSYNLSPVIYQELEVSVPKRVYSRFVGRKWCNVLLSKYS
ncbi:transposable element Tc1 transposase [Trichonephila clavipes]|nr:transposable element Tc1 transposase [Trichonephila clavipes]